MGVPPGTSAASWGFSQKMVFLLFVGVASIVVEAVSWRAKCEQVTTSVRLAGRVLRSSGLIARSFVSGVGSHQLPSSLPMWGRVWRKPGPLHFTSEVSKLRGSCRSEGPVTSAMLLTDGWERMRQWWTESGFHFKAIAQAGIGVPPRSCDCRCLPLRNHAK